jgi:hypothetical protein
MNVHVHVDAASLHELPPHLISEIELRINPDMTRLHSIQEEEPGEEKQSEKDSPR